MGHTPDDQQVELVRMDYEKHCEEIKMRYGENAWKGDQDILEARKKHDVWGRLDEIKCKVLVISGTSYGVALHFYSEDMARKIGKNAISITLEGGHFMINKETEKQQAWDNVQSFLATKFADELGYTQTPAKYVVGVAFMVISVCLCIAAYQQSLAENVDAPHPAEL